MMVIVHAQFCLDMPVIFDGFSADLDRGPLSIKNIIKKMRPPP